MLSVIELIGVAREAGGINPLDKIVQIFIRGATNHTKYETKCYNFYQLRYTAHCHNYNSYYLLITP